MLCLCCVWCGCGDVVLKGVQLSFVETDYTVGEDTGVQHVCVELTGVLETSITITLDTQPNTAIGMHSEWSEIRTAWAAFIHANDYQDQLVVHVHHCTCNKIFRCIFKNHSCSTFHTVLTSSSSLPSQLERTLFRFGRHWYLTALPTPPSVSIFP